MWPGMRTPARTPAPTPTPTPQEPSQRCAQPPPARATTLRLRSAALPAAWRRLSPPAPRCEWLRCRYADPANASPRARRSPFATSCRFRVQRQAMSQPRRAHGRMLLQDSASRLLTGRRPAKSVPLDGQRNQPYHSILAGLPLYRRAMAAAASLCIQLLQLQSSLSCARTSPLDLFHFLSSRYPLRANHEQLRRGEHVVLRPE